MNGAINVPINIYYNFSLPILFILFHRKDNAQSVREKQQKANAKKLVFQEGKKTYVRTNVVQIHEKGKCTYRERRMCRLLV